MATLLNNFNEWANIPHRLDIDPQINLCNDTKFEWYDVKDIQLTDAVINQTDRLIKDQINPNDIYIGTFSNKYGIDIVNSLKEKLSLECTHTYHIDRESRWEKKRFWGDSGKVHCSSIHSLKGLECNYLMICLSDENIKPTTIYVALSRLKYSGNVNSQCIIFNTTEKFAELKKFFNN